MTDLKRELEMIREAGTLCTEMGEHPEKWGNMGVFERVQVSARLVELREKFGAVRLALMARERGERHG